MGTMLLRQSTSPRHGDSENVGEIRRNKLVGGIPVLLAHDGPYLIPTATVEIMDRFLGDAPVLGQIPEGVIGVQDGYRLTERQIALLLQSVYHQCEFFFARSLEPLQRFRHES